MEPLYFLSIVTNTLTGLVLASEHLGNKISFLGALDKLFKKNVGVKIALACLVILIGLIKLVVPYHGIPILGDLFPAAAGLGSGFTLFLDFIRNRSDVKTDSMEKMDKIFLNNKFIIGIGCVLTAVLHFFLFWAIFF